MAKMVLGKEVFQGNNPIMVFCLTTGKKDGSIPKECRDGMTNGDANRLRKAILAVMDAHPEEAASARKRIQEQRRQAATKPERVLVPA